jgi:soluble lytic murein transglycosylase-like protein
MISLGFCNTKTNAIIQEKIDYWVNFYCKKFETRNIKIEPALIKAIIKQESQGKPYCMRLEKHKYYDTNYLNHIPLRHRKNKYSYCSMGIMQVMYGTARWQGFRKSPEDLMLLKYSIKFGVKYVRYLIKRFWSLENVISAYNQGSPRKKDTTKYGEILENQFSYVNHVLRYYKKYGGKIKVDSLIIK